MDVYKVGGENAVFVWKGYRMVCLMWRYSSVTIAWISSDENRVELNQAKFQTLTAQQKVLRVQNYGWIPLSLELCLIIIIYSTWCRLHISRVITFYYSAIWLLITDKNLKFQKTINHSIMTSWWLDIPINIWNSEQYLSNFLICFLFYFPELT